MNPPRPRIGLFGGSFDPVHIGHLLMARDALEQLHLERLIFVPASVNPHRTHATPRAPASARLEMVRLAISDEPRFEADSLELDREGPSYSIDTVECLQRRWPASEIFLLIGEDNLQKLSTWHRYDQLCQKVRFVCFGRTHPGGPPDTLPPIHRLQRRIDISSTEIRVRIAKQLPIRYLVPEPVCRFIDTHGLYLQTETPHLPQASPS